MKQCKACGKEVVDAAKFCPDCGLNDFIALKQRAKPLFRKEPITWRKVMRTAMPIVAAVTALTVLIVIMIVNDAFVVYNIGSFSGNNYTNEWAGIEVEIPSDWEVTDKLKSDGNTDCAFTAKSTPSKSLTVVYTSSSDKDEKDYVNSISDEYGIDFFNIPVKEELAGNTYNVYKASYINANKGFKRYNLYVRKKDGHYILIMCMVSGQSELSSVTSLIVSPENK